MTEEGETSSHISMKGRTGSTVSHVFKCKTLHDDPPGVAFRTAVWIAAEANRGLRFPVGVCGEKVFELQARQARRAVNASLRHGLNRAVRTRMLFRGSSMLVAHPQ